MLENNPKINWFGPDFFNLLGFCKEDFDLVKSNNKKLIDCVDYYMENYSNEIFNRELSYYKFLLRKNVSDELFNQIFDDNQEQETSEQFKDSKNNKNEFGYALLKGRSVNYYIQKFRIIIGRSMPKKYTR